MCVDAYTDEKKFLSLPDMPSVYDYGLKVDLVSFTEGKVVVCQLALPDLLVSE